jgi:hypothetical protein
MPRFAFLSGMPIPVNNASVVAARKPMSEEAKKRIAEELRKSREAKAAQVVASVAQPPSPKPAGSRYPQRTERPQHGGKEVAVLPSGKIYASVGAIAAFARALERNRTPALPGTQTATGAKWMNMTGRPTTTRLSTACAFFPLII